jgi:precorrin-2 dehydrogenase / sirohydrochlorin ferrochelatase
VPNNPYPILLNLHKRSVVIVGGGLVGERKAGSLLPTGATLYVISPVFTSQINQWASANELTCIPQVYESSLLETLQPLLVFATTDSPTVNSAVLEDARKLGALANAADDAATGDFSSMMQLQRGTLTIAWSSGGGSPALSAHLRDRFEGAVGPEYETLLDWMADLRPVIRHQLTNIEARRALWHTILDSDVLRLLQSGEQPAAREQFDALVATALEAK